MYSILHRATRADIRYYPFPHIVINDCLPQDYYDLLDSQYPEDEVIHEVNQREKSPAGAYVVGQNTRNDLPASLILQEPSSVGSDWHEFVKYHTSNEFLQSLYDLLEPEIKTTYPELEKKFKCHLRESSAGVRFHPDLDNGHVSLDCQIGINTPSQKKSSVRGVHTDATEELFAGLLYFRRPNDVAAGGNLEIYRWKDGVKRRFFGEAVDGMDVDLVDTIPYRANTLILFINSELSLHAVSPRNPSPLSRRLVNIIGRVYRSVPEGLFIKHKKPLFSRLRYSITNRLA